MSSTLLSVTPARSSVQDSIVRSADALFTNEGVVPVTLERIAAAADVSMVTLAAAFSSKRPLVVAALQYRHHDWMEGLLAAEAQREEPRDRILTVFGYLEACFADDGYRGCAFINGYGELGRTDPEIAVLAQEHLQQIEAHVASLCVAAALPAHLAQALTLLIEGAQVEAAIHRSSQPARTARTTAAMLMAVYQDDGLF
jgi:AcrR family transcriptional regulator